MKRILLLTQFLFFGSIVFSQTLNTSIRVKDWGMTYFQLRDEFWEMNKENIIKQIGVAEFEKVKKYSLRKNMPGEMLLHDGKTRKNIELYRRKMSALKVYQIAKFNALYNEKGDYKDYIIVMVPYSGNESWDANSKWDTVYFVINGEYIN